MPAAMPPTKILSSITVLPSDARAFLSTFILKADADRHVSSRGDLILSDQRRIEKALQGVFIPKPVETFGNAGTGLNTPVVTNAARTNAQDDEEAVENETETNYHVLQDQIPTVESQPQFEGGVVDKEKRKADKKQRLKDEKKRRAEARGKERQ